MPDPEFVRLKGPEFDDTPEFDPRSGEHFWIVIAVFHDCAPGLGEFYMDETNLVSLTPTGCHYCALPWSELNAKRRCAGNIGRIIRATEN